MPATDAINRSWRATASASKWAAADKQGSSRVLPTLPPVETYAYDRPGAANAMVNLTLESEHTGEDNPTV